MSSPTATPLAAPTGKAPSKAALVAFRIIAAVEAFTWVGLLVGMFFKYIVVNDDIGVKIFGPLHGGAFVIYVIVAFVAWAVYRWSFWTGALALVASIPPLGTVVFERIASKRGHLDPADVRTGKDAS